MMVASGPLVTVQFGTAASRRVTVIWLQLCRCSWRQLCLVECRGCHSVSESVIVHVLAQDTYSSSVTPGRQTGSRFKSNGADWALVKLRIYHVREPRFTYNFEAALLLAAPLAQHGLNPRVEHPDVALNWHATRPGRGTQGFF